MFGMLGILGMLSYVTETIYGLHLRVILEWGQLMGVDTLPPPPLLFEDAPGRSTGSCDLLQ